MEKLERLDELLERRDLASVWFARPNSFAWLTGGSSVVDRSADAGVAAVGYDGETVRVLTDTIEADRIEREELPDLPGDVPVEAFPWYESTLEAALAERASTPAGADVEVPDPEFEHVDPSTVRQPLTERDRDRYRTLGRETAEAVEAVCREARADDTEHELAAALAVALSARNIEAPVVLVGGAERAQTFRHYTPREAELGQYALVSVTSQRHGLHASCTRTIAFDPPTWLVDRHVAAARVETSALAATRAAADGDTAGDVFAAIQEAYAGVGHEGEWKRHHQGGAAGFAGREWIATPENEAPVEVPMAYAWNPTVQGAKSEDTFLVTTAPGTDGFETLTTTGEWPTVSVDAVGDDLTLERHGILGVHEDA